MLRSQEVRRLIQKSDSQKLSYDSILFRSHEDRFKNKPNSKSRKCIKSLGKLVTIILIYTEVLLLQGGLLLYIPVYPSIASEKSLSSTEIGIIMGSMPFICFLIYPFIGVFVTKFSYKISFCVANLGLASSIILFGFIIEINRFWFEFFSFALLIFEAFSLSISNLTCYLIMINTFPKYQTLIIAIQEFAIGFGYVLGPAVGGWLYQLIGFKYMYIYTGSIGLLLLLLILLSLLTVKLDDVSTNNGDDNDKEDYLLGLKFFLKPILVYYLLLIISTTIIWNYFIPVLGPYLIRKYNIKSDIIGLVFLTINIGYLIGTIVVTFLMRFLRYKKIIIFIGLLMQAAGVLIIAPTDRLFKSGINYLYLSYIGMSLEGFGFTLVYFPCLGILLDKSSNIFKGVSNVDTTMLAVFLAIFYLGEGLGPLISGVIAEYMELDAITLYLSCILVLISCSVVVLIVYDAIKSVYKRFNGNGNILTEIYLW